MAIRFDLGDLQAFAAVAELGNFRKAAELVHISQPAFSRRIDKLEVALGVKLLDRNTRKVELTAVGREFARKTRQLLDDLDGTLLGIQEIAATRMGEVTVACVPSAAFYFLPQVVKQYHTQFPNIRVKIQDAGANEVLASVARGEADFGLNFIGSAEADLEFQTVLEEPFVAACRRDHVLATRRSVSWSDLCDHDFMTVSKSSGNRLLMDLALAGLPRRPVCIHEAQHVMTLLGLVEAGLGVAAVPRLAVDHHAGLAEVIHRVQHAQQGGAVHVAVDFGVGGQQVDQRHFFGQRFAAQVVHQVVRVLAADVAAQAHHHRLAHHQAAGHFDVAHHGLSVHLQAFDHEFAHLLERTGHQAEGFGQHDPFDLPRAGGALVVGHHRVHQRAACWRTTLMAAWM
jgi:DNA-binding transcriptional LysR family regulator